MSEVKVTITGQDNTKQATDSARRHLAGLGKESAAVSRQLQTAGNQAATAIRGLGGEFGRITPNIGNFSNGLVSMTGAMGLTATAVIGLVAAGNQLAEQANAYSRIKTSFDGLAAGVGASSDAMLASLQSASRGMISQHDLVLSANRAMLLGVADTEQEMAQLMEVALARGQAMGLSATQAFNDLVTGLGRMSPMILDNLGIVTGGEKVFEEYAASVGKAASALTDAEKTQALINLTVQSSAQIVEDSKSAQVNATATLGVAWTDFSVVLGEKVAPAYDAVKLAAAGALNAMVGVMEGAKVPEWAMEFQGIVASLQAVNMTISQMEQVRSRIGEAAFARKDSFTGIAPLDEYNNLFAQREELYKQHIELVKGIAAEEVAAIGSATASAAAGQTQVIQSTLQQWQSNIEYFQATTGEISRSILEDSAGLTNAQIQQLTNAGVEMFNFMIENGYAAEAAIKSVVARMGESADAMREANGAAAQLGASLGEVITAGADVGTEAILNFSNVASTAIAGLQASLSGFMADMHAGTAEADRILGVRTRRDGSGQLPQRTRERINKSKVFNPVAVAEDGSDRFSGMADRLVPVFDDLYQSGRGAATAIAEIAPSLAGLLGQIPGLFGTSAVTAEDMALGNGYQNKADEYLRRLRDEVQNGTDWEGVDVKDAAAALGIDPAMAAEEVLKAFEAAWANQSLFANAENLKFIDMEAVQANIEQQLAQAEGEKNLKALFGVGTAEDIAAVAALGLEIQNGLSAWLAENGFDDAGMNLAAALGTGVAKSGSEMGTGVAGGLDSWASSEEGASEIKDFAERLGAEISKHLKVTPNMELPDDPASDAGGAGNGDAGAPGGRGGNTDPGGPTQSASANVYVTNNRMDVEQAGRDIARRMRR